MRRIVNARIGGTLGDHDAAGGFAVAASAWHRPGSSVEIFNSRALPRVATEQPAARQSR